MTSGPCERASEFTPSDGAPPPPSLPLKPAWIGAPRSDAERAYLRSVAVMLHGYRGPRGGYDWVRGYLVFDWWMFCVWLESMEKEVGGAR